MSTSRRRLIPRSSERFTLGILSHDGLLRAAGKLLQQAALEVLLRHLRDQQLQQQIQDAED